MRFLWLAAALLLGISGPVSAQDREGYIAADDGTRLFYRVEGDGPQTLVVVHGGPGNSMESVRPDFGPLARGRRVIYYDQRGNGRSQLLEADEQLAVEHHVADLDAIRRHFGLERLTLLGNSWGGLLVSLYAAAHPDRVERLILDAAAPPFHGHFEQAGENFAQRSLERLSLEERRRLDFAREPRNWVEAEDPVAVCRDFGIGMFRLYAFEPTGPPSFRGDTCAGPPEAVRRQRAVNAAIWRSLGAFDLRPDVRRVTAPVLVIHGVTDAIPIEAAEDWAESYPNGRLLRVPRTGHLIHLEQPDIFFAAVEDFLAGRWPETAEDVGSRSTSPASD